MTGMIVSGKMMTNELEIRRDGVTLCICVGEECFPDAETMNTMRAWGYKFYMDGKIYKKKGRNADESED